MSLPLVRLSRTPVNAHLLFGKQRFLKEEFIRDLRSRLLGGRLADDNFRNFTVGSDRFSSFLEFCSTSPFIAEMRMAVLWDVDRLAAGEKRLLLERIERLSANAALLFCTDESGPKKDPFLKALAEVCRPQAFHVPFDRELVSWLEGRFRKTGISIDRGACEELLRRVGRELAFLATAVETLVVYAGARPSITAQDVRDLFGNVSEEDIFRLLESLIEGRAENSVRHLETLLLAGARVAEITAFLSGQLERLEKVKALADQGRDAAAVAAELRLHPFVAEKMLRQAKSSERSRLRLLWRQILALDVSVKEGRLPEALAAERFVAAACA